MVKTTAHVIREKLDAPVKEVFELADRAQLSSGYQPLVIG